MKLIQSMTCLGVLALVLSMPTHAAQVWTEGVNYFLIQPARAPSVPAGKVEVTEVFSYACPACNIFQPTMHKLKQAMPANVVVDYLPAALRDGANTRCGPAESRCHVRRRVEGRRLEHHRPSVSRPQEPHAHH
jgi:protein-disulfide isomerase